MFSYIEKKRLYTIERFMFPAQSDEIHSSCSLINIYNSYDEPRCKSIKLTYKTDTLLSDLTKTKDEIPAVFNAATRHQVRKAIREDIEIKFMDSNFLSENESVLIDLKDAYADFCRDVNKPGLLDYFDLEKLKYCIKENAVTVGTAHFQNGRVSHVYLNDSKVCLWLYTVSDFRKNGVDKNLAGRANKLLLYSSMLYFKNKGLELYDWGGIRNIESPNSIDTFKLAFGGTPAVIYNAIIGNTLWGKILVILKLIFEKFKR